MYQEQDRPTIIQTSGRVLTPRDPVYIPIEIGEWDRITARIKDCRISLNLWSVVYSVMFGIAVTSGLSIWPILDSDAPASVVMTYVSITSASLAAAVSLVVAERLFSKRNTAQIDNVVSDMTRRKDSFVPSEEY